MVIFFLNKCNYDIFRLEKKVVLNELMNVKFFFFDWYYNCLEYMFIFRCINNLKLSIGLYLNLYVMNYFICLY